MIDYDKINSFRELETKEAKAKLADYAVTLGVKLNKQKSFDNMLSDLEEEVSKIPVQEELKEIVEDKTPDNVPHGDDPVDEPDTKTDFDDEVKEEIIEPDVTEQTEPEPTPEIIEPVQSKAGVPDWITNFNPTVILIGSASAPKGFYTCPWWLYDWILLNADWKENPTKCPHYGSANILKSLAYYVYRDGDVTVRETRNSKFHTLK